jgi:hypothetical protein
MGTAVKGKDLLIHVDDGTGTTPKVGGMWNAACSLSG